MKRYRMRKINYTVNSPDVKLIEDVVNNINCALQGHIENSDSVSKVLDSIEIKMLNLEQVGEHVLRVEIIVNNLNKEEK